MFLSLCHGAVNFKVGKGIIGIWFGALKNSRASTSAPVAQRTGHVLHSISERSRFKSHSGNLVTFLFFQNQLLWQEMTLILALICLEFLWLNG